MEIPYTIDKGKAYLSHTDGMWRVIWKGIPINADTPDRRRAEAMAKHYKLKLAEGIIWTENGWVRDIQGNPPMYAHHLNEIKAHGLSVKQMRRLYAMVSRGNQKAITFARNVLGIPFDETPSQVKAIVRHHLIDLGGRRVRGNRASFKTKYANIEKTDKKRIYTGFAHGIVYRIEPWWNGREYGWEAKVMFPGDLDFVMPDMSSYPIRALDLQQMSEKLKLVEDRGIARLRGMRPHLRGNPAGKVTEGEIRRMYKRMGQVMYRKTGLYGPYHAISQYGYTLMDRLPTRKSAEDYVIRFYKSKSPSIIRG